MRKIPHINLRTSDFISDAKKAVRRAVITPHPAENINAFLSISLFLICEYSAAAEVGRKYTRFIPLAVLYDNSCIMVINMIRRVPPPIPQPDRIPVANDAMKLIISFSLLRI